MSTYSQAQFSKNKSAVTGQKFKLRSGKSIKRREKPINYINSLDLSIGLGGSTYYGELCDGVGCGMRNLLPSFHLGVYYRWSAHLSVRGELGYVPLRGTDVGGEHEKTRGLKFNTTGYELTGTAIYDFVAFRKMYRQRSLISPYALIGIGLYMYEPYATYNGTKYKLRDYRTEESKDYGKATVIIPVGIGIRIPLSPFLEIAGEARYTKTFTDHIDDISNQYPHTDTQNMSQDDLLLADPAASRGDHPTYVGNDKAVRGRPDTKDGYYNFELKIIYTLKVTHQRYNINSNRSKFRMVNGVKKRH